jgi:EAL domain-containing protein (putative c-di-GMP-specific phosphodiesterase class I)
MGIALNTLPYQRAEELLRDADTAMYHAKAQGKACYKVFDASMHSRAVTLLQLENDLRRAIERQEFQLHYQPIVSLETSKIVGFEALIRWQHPEKGLISPVAFIPVAEETGLIYAVGTWVLQTACQQMQAWNQCTATGSPLVMSVNLSGKQFAQPDLVDKISDILRETGLRAQQLRIEITESVIMENADVAIAMLEQLRRLGVQLAIDDFGTGYSSLGYLHRFPVNALKIDRSFVSPIGGANTEDQQISTSIVRTIVNLAHNIGMTVTAEGIETLDQLAFLRELCCENGQGYLFSKPLNAQAAQALITTPLLQAV